MQQPRGTSEDVAVPANPQSTAGVEAVLLASLRVAESLSARLALCNEQTKQELDKALRRDAAREAEAALLVEGHAILRRRVQVLEAALRKRGNSAAQQLARVLAEREEELRQLRREATILQAVHEQQGPRHELHESAPPSLRAYSEATTAVTAAVTAAATAATTAAATDATPLEQLEQRAGPSVGSMTMVAPTASHAGALEQLEGLVAHDRLMVQAHAALRFRKLETSMKRLLVAERLEKLGNGGRRPPSPSGEAPEGGEHNRGQRAKLIKALRHVGNKLQQQEAALVLRVDELAAEHRRMDEALTSAFERVERCTQWLFCGLSHRAFLEWSRRWRSQDFFEARQSPAQPKDAFAGHPDRGATKALLAREVNEALTHLSTAQPNPPLPPLLPYRRPPLAPHSYLASPDLGPAHEGWDLASLGLGQGRGVPSASSEERPANWPSQQRPAAGAVPCPFPWKTPLQSTVTKRKQLLAAQQRQQAAGGCPRES